MRNKKQKHDYLMRAVRRYVHAYNCDSWKGGGDPADIPAIERELRNARKALKKTIAEVI